MTPPADWLVAFDTRLCQRLSHCSLCGQPLGTGGGSLAFFELERLTVSCAFCPPCTKRPGSVAALIAKLDQRYAGWADAAPQPRQVRRN